MNSGQGCLMVMGKPEEIFIAFYYYYYLLNATYRMICREKKPHKRARAMQNQMGSQKLVTQTPSSQPNSQFSLHSNDTLAV